MAKSRRLPEEQKPTPIPPLSNEFAGQLVEIARQLNTGLMMLLKDNPETNQLIVGMGVNVEMLGTLAVAISRQTAIDSKTLENLFRQANPWWTILAENYGEDLAGEAEALRREAEAELGVAPVDLDDAIAVTPPGSEVEEASHYGH